MTLDFAENRASAQDILDHLAACDETFCPRLSSRVNLAAYSQKIASKAQRFEAWSTGELVGLVAAYWSDTDGGIVFVSNVSVLPNYTGQGIARRLMISCRDQASEKGFVCLSLEVDPNAHPALYLYQRLGFQIEDSDGAKPIRMALQLTNAVDGKC
jgi:ribosomal protein S18 acetylase RimI-like enzyme